MSEKYPFLDIAPPDHIVELAERYKAFRDAWNRELRRLSICEVRQLLADNQRAFDRCLYLTREQGYCPESIRLYETLVWIITDYLEATGKEAQA